LRILQQRANASSPINTPVTPPTLMSVGEWTRRTPDEFAASVRELMDWFVQGKLKPHVTDRFPLARAPEAIALMAARKVKGKVVVTIGDG